MVLDAAAEAMVPLATFISCMAEGLFIDGVNEQFKTLAMVFQSSKVSPKDAKESIEAVRHATASSDKTVLATFEGLQQGKRMLELAAKVAEDREKTHKHLERIETAESYVESVLTALNEHPDDYSAFDVDKLVEADELARECESLQSLDEASKSRVVEIRNKVASVIGHRVITAHLMTDFKPWLVASQSALVGSGALPNFPSFHIRKLLELRERSGKLDSLFKFHETIPDVVNLIRDMTAKKITPQAVCTAVQKWEVECQKFGKQFPLIESYLTPILCKLLNIAEESYLAEMSLVLQQAAKVIEKACLSRSSGDMLFGSIEKAVVQGAVSKCDEGRILVTGIRDVDTKCKAIMTVDLCKGLLQWISYTVQRQGDSKKVDAFCSILSAFEVGLCKNMDAKSLVIDQKSLEGKITMAFGVLFIDATGDSSSQCTTTVDAFAGFVVPRMVILVMFGDGLCVCALKSGFALLIFVCVLLTLLRQR